MALENLLELEPIVPILLKEYNLLCDLMLIEWSELKCYIELLEKVYNKNKKDNNAIIDGQTQPETYKAFIAQQKIPIFIKYCYANNNFINKLELYKIIKKWEANHAMHITNPELTLICQNRFKDVQNVYNAITQLSPHYSQIITILPNTIDILKQMHLIIKLQGKSMPIKRGVLSAYQLDQLSSYLSKLHIYIDHQTRSNISFQISKLKYDVNDGFYMSIKITTHTNGLTTKYDIGVDKMMNIIENIGFINLNSLDQSFLQNLYDELLGNKLTIKSVKIEDKKQSKEDNAHQKSQKGPELTIKEMVGWLNQTNNIFKQLFANHTNFQPIYFHEKCRIKDLIIEVYDRMNEQKTLKKIVSTIINSCKRKNEKEEDLKKRNDKFTSFLNNFLPTFIKQFYDIGRRFFSYKGHKLHGFGQYVGIAQLQYQLYIKYLKTEASVSCDETKFFQREFYLHVLVEVENRIKSLLSSNMCYADFVGAQLIKPYKDHETTVKAIKALANENLVKFNSRENLIYHLVKHLNETKEKRRSYKSIFKMTNAELLKEINKYFRTSQWVIQSSISVESYWEQMGSSRTFKFNKCNDNHKYMSAVLVSENGEVLLKTLYISSSNENTNQSERANPSGKMNARKKTSASEKTSAITKMNLSGKKNVRENLYASGKNASEFVDQSSYENDEQPVRKHAEIFVNYIDPYTEFGQCWNLATQIGNIIKNDFI